MGSAMPGVKRAGPPRMSRRERAKATHWRIVRAAYTLFCAQGYAATTMAQIAEAAAVAVQTVYFGFHVKSALLSRAYDFAVMGEDEPVPPEMQPWYGAMAAESDVVRALGHMLEGLGEITRRVTPLYLAARAAADGDPEAAKVIALHERWRADGYRRLLELLRHKAALRPGLTLKRATDLLLLFGGMDVYHALVVTQRWSHQEWVDWSASTLAHQLFGYTPNSRRRLARGAYE
jgi:AcrR family transcriptional regulator